jgi:hypothetical protein
MKKAFNQVYQFKITLRGAKPPIWRRIQVPESYSFWDLHVAIQDAMGWDDCHLHSFEIANLSNGLMESIGIPDDDSIWSTDTKAGWKTKIADFFTIDENNKADYTYDFGDGWEHIIKLEKILPREKGVKYPICIKGKRACPPEDCGGIWGYMELLEIISDPDHEEYESMLEWVGGEIDPDHFDVKEVQFSDPAKRLKSAF